MRLPFLTSEVNVHVGGLIANSQVTIHYHGNQVYPGHLIEAWQ